MKSNVSYLTVVLSRPGREAASIVVGRLALVERLESTVVDVLAAVAGRVANKNECDLFNLTVEWRISYLKLDYGTSDGLWKPLSY